MKKLTRVFLLSALLFGLMITACKKKDTTPNNQMTLDNVEYELSQGFIENYGRESDTEGYNLDLILLSSGFTTHEVAGTIDSLSGSGDGIVFEFFSSSSDKLDVGDYNFDANETYQAGTFDYSNVVIAYNTQTDEGTDYDITAGKVTVANSGAEYELSFDVTLVNGKNLTGFYKGSVKYYDSTINPRSIDPKFYWFK